MYKKILVPLDGSELAENAIKHVEIFIGTKKIQEVVLLQVIERSAGTLYNLETDIKERIEKGIKDYLGGIADAFREHGINVKSIVKYGDAAETILNYVDENNIGIIIMSTHGRSGISRFLAGSVAERVMRHSTVPILIIPPPRSETDDYKQMNPKITNK